ncbi:MAG: helical backbone metal receptor [Candidatus Cloacimonetes bacterium]|nr:helical backbone metal receptor [Candidatus Cloacimonadota bacterium]
MKYRILVFVFLLLLAGCQKKNSTHDSRLTTHNKNLPSHVSRLTSHYNVVVTSPEVAEIICELGLIDLISGVTLECDYPPELKDKTIVGTFGKVDMEKVIALEPDIVFVAGLEQEFLASELNKLDIKVEMIYPNSVEAMLQSIIDIGNILKVSEKSLALKQELKLEIAGLQAAMGERRPEIYVEIYGNPLMSVSDSSYVGQLVELAGFDNIFSSLPRAYSRISPEDVINASPEYILLLYPGITAEQFKQRKGWQRINAVVNNRIFTEKEINSDLLLRATPRSIRSLPQLAGLRTYE